MLCENCGEQMNDTARFCVSCGTRESAKQEAKQAAVQAMASDAYNQYQENSYRRKRKSLKRCLSA